MKDSTDFQPVQLFGVGTFGKSRTVRAQQRTNLYSEIDDDGEKTTIHLYPTPGLVFQFTLGAEPSRGFYAVGVDRYIVNRNSLYKISNNNIVTSVGTLLTTTGRVSMKDNGVQLIIVDGTVGGGYIYTFSTGVFQKITAPGFPGGTTVDFMNGYFIVSAPDSGRFYLSSLYDGLAWSALDFSTAESNPDQLIAIKVSNGQLILYGTETIEFWGDSGAQDFPFARIGAAAVEWGLAARWSVLKFVDSMIFLGKNRLGAIQVFVMDGGVAVPVSTPDLDYLFSQYAKSGGVSNATSIAYMVSGHPMYQINFPSQDVSWCFDAKSKEWHILQYGSSSRHLGELHYSHQDESYMTSYQDGSVYKLDTESYTDNGVYIVREIISRHQFPVERMPFSQLWVEFEPGQGLQLGQGSNPMAMLQYSKDGGFTWSAELWSPIGKAGEYHRRAVWRRLGAARDWVFRIRITDPVKVVMVSAWGIQE